MSSFGDWWVKTRNSVEARVEALFLALEPAAEDALVKAVKAGVAAALVKKGTPGDMWVSARDAALAILKADGITIAQTVVENAITEQLGSTPPSA